jgi:hypothetical protein
VDANTIVRARAFNRVAREDYTGGSFVNREKRIMARLRLKNESARGMKPAPREAYPQDVLGQFAAPRSTETASVWAGEVIDYAKDQAFSADCHLGVSLPDEP